MKPTAFKIDYLAQGSVGIIVDVVRVGLNSVVVRQEGGKDLCRVKFEDLEAFDFDVSERS